MKQYVVWRLHRNGLSGVEQVRPGEATHAAAERVQREWGYDGELAALTYQVCEGNVIDALVASSRLPVAEGARS